LDAGFFMEKILSFFTRPSDNLLSFTGRASAQWMLKRMRFQIDTGRTGACHFMAFRLHGISVRHR